MNRRLAGLVLFITFSSCQQNHKSKDIIQLREKLPLIEIPIKFNSDVRVKYKTVELEDNDLIKNINRYYTFSALGKIFESKNSITILGYTYNKIGTPVLITFDNDGNEISTHVIFETAKSLPGYHVTNIVSILPNRQILFTDSTVTRNMNIDGVEEYDVVDSVSVTHKKYVLPDNGLIELIK